MKKELFCCNLARFKQKFDISHADSLSLILICEPDHVEVNKQNQERREGIQHWGQFQQHFF